MQRIVQTCPFGCSISTVTFFDVYDGTDFETCSILLLARI